MAAGGGSSALPIAQVTPGETTESAKPEEEEEGAWLNGWVWGGSLCGWARGM